MALISRDLGRRDYPPVFAAMQAFTAARAADTPDELWRVEHPPVFTLGLAGKPEHLLAPGDIPVIQADRGGQVTYHGPGQVVIYCLLDVRRLGLSVRVLVTALEEAVIELLAAYRIAAHARPTAPGVYVDDAKIAALEPFTRINPCGYPGLRVTQLRDLGVDLTPDAVAADLLPKLARRFSPFDLATG